MDDNDGIRALEELLSTDPTLAALFGSEVSGKIAKTAINGIGGKVPGAPEPFKGVLFPTYVQRRDGSKQAGIEIPQGDVARATFMTDVRNDYFTRKRPARGRMSFEGALDVPSFHLFNGRLTFTCAADKALPIGTSLSTEILITDKHGSGPFKVRIDGVIVAARPSAPSRPPPVPRTEKEKEPLVDAGPSRPNIKQVDRGPDALPATVEKDAKTGRLAVFINTTSKHLEAALAMRKPAEKPAVRFVYIYGLALVVMGLLDTARGTEEWKANEGVCREKIAQTAIGVARVIVPLCLSLPKNLPKSKS